MAFEGVRMSFRMVYGSVDMMSRMVYGSVDMMSRMLYDFVEMNRKRGRDPHFYLEYLIDKLRK